MQQVYHVKYRIEGWGGTFDEGVFADSKEDAIEKVKASYWSETLIIISCQASR